MASYLILPNELKDLINLSQQDISRLSRTSKSMRKALLPQLLKRISLSWEQSEPPPCISSLLRLVLQSPDLAMNVEELNFYGIGYKIGDPEGKGHCAWRYITEDGYGYYQSQDYGDEEYQDEERPEVDGSVTGCKPLLEKAIRSMKLSEDKQGLMLGGLGELDLIIALIIVNCPNLKVLRLGVNFLHRNTFLTNTLHHFLGLEAGSSTCALAKLEKVYLAKDMLGWFRVVEEPVVIPLSSCLPFFYLPSLEIFSMPPTDRLLVSTSPSPPTEWPTTTPPISAIRRLDLHSTRVKPASLAFILAQTPHLENLRYNYCCNDGMLDCTGLRSALDFVSGTLTELIIAFEIYEYESCEEEHVPSSWRKDDRWNIGVEGPGSLAPLSRLTTLEIALGVLLGRKRDDVGLGLEDVLPSGLEEICVRDDCMRDWGMRWEDEETIEEVGRWLKSKSRKTCTPSIKRLGVRVCETGYEQWGEQWQNSLEQICEAEDVKFWFERRIPGYEWDTSLKRYEKVDNPLQFPWSGW